MRTEESIEAIPGQQAADDHGKSGRRQCSRRCGYRNPAIREQSDSVNQRPIRRENDDKERDREHPELSDLSQHFGGGQTGCQFILAEALSR